MKIKKILKGIGISLATIVAAFFAFVWFGTYHPADIESMAVSCSDTAPTLQAGQSLKVMTWNVQFMAGKNYTFWFDVPNNDGPDERPSPADITQTLSEVARVIKNENPDIIMLEEVDNGAHRLRRSIGAPEKTFASRLCMQHIRLLLENHLRAASADSR